MIYSPIRSPIRSAIRAAFDRRIGGGGSPPASNPLANARILVDWSDAANHGNAWADNENAPGHTANLCAFPSGPITNESGSAVPTKTNYSTLTTDPSGVTNYATRLVSTAVNQVLYIYRPSLHAGLPNGPYVLRFRARSAPGTGSHAISFGLSASYASGTVQDLDWSDSANDAATTFTREFTFSGSGDVAIRLNASGADVLIDRIQWYEGAASSLPAWSAEVHTGGMPPYSWANALTVAAEGAVNTASAVGGLLLVDPAFPAKHAYAAYTIITMMALDSNPTGTGGHLMNVHPFDGGSTSGNILFAELTSPYTGEINTFPSVTRSQMAVNAVGKGYLALGQSRDLTTRKVYFDGIKTFESATAFSTQNIARWTVSSWTTTDVTSLRSNYGRGRYAISAVWNRALSDAEYASAVDAMRARVVSRGGTMAAFDWHVISGDSNSTRGTGDWSQLVTAAGYQSPGADMLAMITSVGGQGIDDIDVTGTRFDLMDGPALLRGTDNGRLAYYHLCIGTNDWDILDGYSGSTSDQAAAYVARVQALIAKALAVHTRVRVIWYSLLPQNATSRPNWEDQRLLVNSSMTTWITSQSRVFLCNVGGSATIGSRALQAGGGGTYYLSDEIHLTPAGDAEFASIQKTALAAARAAG